MDVTSSLSFLRSLSFGGIIGSLTAMVIFLYAPEFWAPYLSLYQIMMLGGVIGTGFHRAFDKVIVQGILHPVGDFITYYGKCLQLEIQRKNGFIDEKTYRRIKTQLDSRHFLNDHSSDLFMLNESPANKKILTRLNDEKNKEKS